YDRKSEKPDRAASAEIGLVWEDVPEELRHGDGGLNIMSLVGVLWKAIQELNQKVENLSN
ncbi:MAG: hypothetical protein WDA59_05150, partial [Methanofastidiosum sp.]